MRKRDLLILLAALTTAAVTAVGIFSGSALPTGAWGLSFRQEGAPPIGNAGIDQLKRYDAAYIGSTSEKVLYLTFDAGYENGCTEKILDTLQKHNVKAAFFLVGNYIEKKRRSGAPDDGGRAYRGQPHHAPLRHEQNFRKGGIHKGIAGLGDAVQGHHRSGYAQILPPAAGDIQ